MGCTGGSPASHVGLALAFKTLHACARVDARDRRVGSDLFDERAPLRHRGALGALDVKTVEVAGGAGLREKNEAAMAKTLQNTVELFCCWLYCCCSVLFITCNVLGIPPTAFSMNINYWDLH